MGVVDYVAVLSVPRAYGAAVGGGRGGLRDGRYEVLVMTKGTELKVRNPSDGLMRLVALEPIRLRPKLVFFPFILRYQPCISPPELRPEVFP